MFQRTKASAKDLVVIVIINMDMIPIKIMPCMLQFVGNIILIHVHLGIDAGNGTSVELVQRQARWVSSIKLPHMVIRHLDLIRRIIMGFSIDIPNVKDGMLNTVDILLGFQLIMLYSSD